MKPPKCCGYCRFAPDLQERLSGTDCKPEYIMAAKMSGKCPSLETKYDQQRFPGYYQYVTKSYRLEPENDT